MSAGSGGHKVTSASEIRTAARAALETRAEFTATDAAASVGASEAWGRKVVREWRVSGEIVPVRQEGQTMLWRFRSEDRSEMALAGLRYAAEAARPEFAMWRSMRRERQFRPEDIQLVANTEDHPLTVQDVQKYCALLTEAGYLRVAIGGRVGQRSPVYAMAHHNAGPFPPRLVRVPAIYDPNDGQYRVLERRVRA